MQGTRPPLASLKDFTQFAVVSPIVSEAAILVLWALLQARSHERSSSRLRKARVHLSSKLNCSRIEAPPTCASQGSQDMTGCDGKISRRHEPKHA
eukprot:scaffold88678_cov31-Tisochrysis_lutea.AAC.2